VRVWPEPGDLRSHAEIETADRRPPTLVEIGVWALLIGSALETARYLGALIGLW